MRYIYILLAKKHRLESLNSRRMLTLYNERRLGRYYPFDHAHSVWFNKALMPICVKMGVQGFRYVGGNTKG